MKIATYKGGLFNEGRGEVLSCCLCGCRDYEKLIVQRLGIAVGMSGNDYTFCDSCWNGPNLGKRLLQMLGFDGGMVLNDDAINISDIQDER